MNEWEFAGEIKEWWTDEIHRHPQWKLQRAAVERGVSGGQQRHDLSVFAGGTVVFTGELRLPDHPHASPWLPENVDGAIHKAHGPGARWCFTSDSQVLLLIEVNRSGPALTRIVERVDLKIFERRAELDSAAFLSQVEHAWREAFRRIAPIIVGQAAPTGMPPDEIFVNSLRALLANPVAAIRDELNDRRLASESFAAELVTWMVDDQGWPHSAQNWPEELDRAARLSAYVFATRLLFYEVLRRSIPKLGRLQLGSQLGADLAAGILEVYFKNAREQSGDYQTIFDWDRVSRFALISDHAVPGWVRLIDQLAVFDLSKLSFDIVGKIFERLIDPHERHRWGQHYTQSAVVDLMNSLAIPDGEGALLDPAAGGGTFLVRAYARKRALKPTKTHQDLLAELYGVDASAFAANLATVNLAARDLVRAENFPRVVAKSFFKVDPGSPFFRLPSRIGTSLGAGAESDVTIDRVQAVSTNPPYVKLQDLGVDRQEEAKASLARDQNVPTPARLHGLANYHIYFWLHAGQFLLPKGRLVFLTSGEWLDSDYGADLQLWLLRNFRILCCVESMAEPWFSEARVGTVMIAAERCVDEEERADSLVRFVLLRRTLQTLYGQQPDDSHLFAAVDELRDRILGLTGAGEGPDMDWSTVRQADLLAMGFAN